MIYCNVKFEYECCLFILLISFIYDFIEKSPFLKNKNNNNNFVRLYIFILMKKIISFKLIL